MAQPTSKYGTYQLLSDYQYDDNGGNGNLRIMTFYPNNNLIKVYTYSPYTHQYETDEKSRFTVPFKMNSTSTKSFSIIVLPDTQYYASTYKEIFESQIQWIIDNHVELNIAYVIHLGDIVENYESETQWQFVQLTMNHLTENSIPYSTLTGNHDGDIFSGNFANYNTYFPATNDQHYGDGNENNYALIKRSGVPLLLLNLQIQPTQSQLDWANEVIQAHPDRLVILSTHSYIADDSGALNGEGQNIYNQVVQPNHVPLVLCGHNGREALRFD